MIRKRRLTEKAGTRNGGMSVTAAKGSLLKRVPLAAVAIGTIGRMPIVLPMTPASSPKRGAGAAIPLFRITRLYGLPLLLLLAALQAQAATYYVTQSGASLRNGTSLANAWSLADFNGSGVPTGGDTVMFSGTFTDTVYAKSGTGNGASRLTHNFTGATLNTANPRINIQEKNYLNLYGGVFGTSAGDSMISTKDWGPSHDVTISGWSYTGETNSVAVFANVPQLSFVLVENNTVDNIANFYIGGRTTSHDITIRNNYARSSTNITAQTDVIFIGDGVNVVIEGNKLINRAPGDGNNRHNDVIQTFHSGSAPHGDPRNWILRYNWIETGALTGDGNNSWLMIEDIAGNPGMKIYGNVFYGYGSSGNNGLCMTLNTDSGVFFLYNNTVVRTPAPGNTIRFILPGTLYARNNIGYSTQNYWGMTTWTMAVGATWNRNFFWNGEDCNSTVTGPNGSCNTDPKFVDFANQNFSLQATSTLIAAGDNSVGAEYSMGIAPGATWPNPTLVSRGTGAWTVGAYVYGATPPPVGNGCDLNADTVVNALDLQNLVNGILTGANNPAHDIDDSGTANAVDVQLEANVILGTRTCP